VLHGKIQVIMYVFNIHGSNGHGLIGFDVILISEWFSLELTTGLVVINVKSSMTKKCHEC
jgi:hypothetical protein